MHRILIQTQAKEYRFYKFYIETKNSLSDEQKSAMQEILTNFPSAGNSWKTIKNFLQTDFNGFDKELIRLAANAYDSFGNTVLGVACEYGHSVHAIQKLIDFGADLDTPDRNMNKLALHWAINNKAGYKDRNTYEGVAAIQCLLKNGADPSITCYQNTTPLEYAENRGFPLAAKLIRNYQGIRDATLFMMCFLHEDFSLKKLPIEITYIILDFIVGSNFLKFIKESKEITRFSFFVPSKSINVTSRQQTQEERTVGNKRKQVIESDSSEEKSTNPQPKKITKKPSSKQSTQTFLGNKNESSDSDSNEDMPMKVNRLKG